MKEPLTLQPIKLWKENTEEDYISTPISVLRYITALEGIIETDRQSFIDSLRGKIEAQKAIVENSSASFVYRDAYNDGLDKILTLLNETSGETGK